MSMYVLYFFIYCFIGWVWESSYVSIRKREWVNRGFMHGPILPIYGVGGLLCVYSGYVTNYYWLATFFVAIILCSTMELLTGLSMEHLFKTRYWDYSDTPGNIKGYICPPVSLFWGVLALLVSTFIQPELVFLTSMINAELLHNVILVLMLGTGFDYAISWTEAMDLRHMLEEAETNNVQLQEIKRRIEGAGASIGESAADISKAVNDARSILADDILETSQSVYGSFDLYRRAQSERVEYVEQFFKSMGAKIPEAHVSEVLSALGRVRESLTARHPDRDRRVKRIMRRNPRLSAPALPNYLEQLHKLAEKSNKDGR